MTCVQFGSLLLFTASWPSALLDIVTVVPFDLFSVITLSSTTPAVSPLSVYSSVNIPDHEHFQNQPSNAFLYYSPSFKKSYNIRIIGILIYISNNINYTKSYKPISQFDSLRFLRSGLPEYNDIIVFFRKKEPKGGQLGDRILVN